MNADINPARFPEELPEFFIRFLTEPGDVVLDIFAGSNATGTAAERLGRRWLAFEIDKNFLATSAFRFIGRPARETVVKLYDELTASENVVEILNEQGVKPMT